MILYKSRTKNFLYLIYRLYKPIFDPVKFGLGIYGYSWFLRDLIKYKRLDKGAKIFIQNLYPVLDEKVNLTPFDAHYFFQQVWCFGEIFKERPVEHVDIGSTYELSGYISRITKATFVDLRPIKADLDNLTIIKGDILKLPFKNNSIKSLSCLHVAEHVGLGRYGDPINPKGTEIACQELSRVLAPGGKLYFSLPVGAPRVCFNAHRVFSPETVIKYFSNLELVSFSIVDDQRRFYPSVDYHNYLQSDFSCGLFVFKK